MGLLYLSMSFFLTLSHTHTHSYIKSSFSLVFVMLSPANAVDVAPITKVKWSHVISGVSCEGFWSNLTLNNIAAKEENKII